MGGPKPLIDRYSCRPAGLLLGLALLLLSLPVSAADPVAKVVVARGGVAIERPGASAPLVARTGTILEAGDIVNTGPRGRAVVLMNDETAVQLNRNTRFQLKEVARTAGWFGSGRFLRAAKRAVASAYELTRGQAFVRNKNRQLALTLGTPVVTLGIRGTEFTVTVAADGATTVDVLEGSVAADNSFGNLVADRGERIITDPG
ncbi:MAG: FecR family protein, partial [Gammaproteobacteria bacterium]|nr:FecR family protein [Gammaproteobacteria bacterium]